MKGLYTMQTINIVLHDFDRATEHAATLTYRVLRADPSVGYRGGVEVLTLACPDRPEWVDGSAVMEAAEDALAAGEMDDDEMVVTVRGGDDADRLPWEANATMGEVLS